MLVVPNELLVKQYQSDLNMYITDTSKVKIKTITTVQHEDTDSSTVVICDEFDEMLKDHAVVFNTVGSEAKLSGLAPIYHFRKKYFLSATYDSYDLTVLKNAFDVQEPNYHDCWSKQEIALGNRTQPFNANTVVRKTEKELEDCLLRQAK